MITEAIETVNSVRKQLGDIGLFEILEGYQNGRIALSREEADHFELVLNGFRETFNGPLTSD